MTRCQALLFLTIGTLPPSERSAVIIARPHEASAGSRGAAGAARRAQGPGPRTRFVRSPTRRCSGHGDDGRSRTLRRRVTLIFGGYRGGPRQSTHDSGSSGGRAVYLRELGRQSVSHLLVADPRNRASDHPPSSRSVPEPHLKPLHRCFRRAPGATSSVPGTD